MTESTVPAKTDTTPKPGKPGWRTSEFWLTSAALMIGTLYASGAIAPEGTSGIAKIIAFAAAALTTAGYTISRGMAKAKS
jgi:hypothetical protein